MSPLLWHRKSCPRLSGSAIFTSVNSFFDKICLGALGGSLGSLLGALGGSLGFTSGALGCSSVYLGGLLGSFWMLLRPSSPPIRCSRVFQNDVPTTFASQTSISRFVSAGVGLDLLVLPRPLLSSLLFSCIALPHLLLPCLALPCLVWFGWTSSWAALFYLAWSCLASPSLALVFSSPRLLSFPL